MNAEDLSLVIVIVGPRGGCKTLLMTHFELETLARAWAVKRLRKLLNNLNLYPRRKVNAWSNYPVHGLWVPPGHNKPVSLSASPLDMDSLVVWAPEFQNGVIFFDEIDQAADRQDWMSTFSKMLTTGVKVMRHRNLSLIASLQFVDELNMRLFKQADVIIKTRDMAWTPWGRERNLQMGEISNTTWIDKSGIMTGYGYDEKEQVFPLQFFGKRYWGNYETLHDFNILDYKRKYKLNLETKEITDASKIEEEQRNRGALHQTIEYFIYNNPEDTRVKPDDFWAMANKLGYSGINTTWGRYLKSLGVKFKGAGNYSYYVFDGVNIDRVMA